MKQAIVFLFAISWSCVVLAQEDRPLPSLFEIDTVTEEAPAKDLFFQNRTLHAVTMDVRREVNKVSLIAKNISLYPYTVTVHFIKSRNLLPTPDPTQEFVVYPGTDVLINFRIFVPSETFDFDFKADNKIGDHSLSPVADYPYMLPLAEETKVPVSPNYGDDFRPTFPVRKGDTIHAMRSGVVTALPRTDGMVDRIVTGSIEVRHVDGTVMVYEDADPFKVLVRLGERVRAAQPLGHVDTAHLAVSLYQVGHDEKLKLLKPLLYIEEGSILPFSEIGGEITVSHPETLIINEMRPKRARKLKGK